MSEHRVILDRRHPLSPHSIWPLHRHLLSHSPPGSQHKHANHPSSDAYDTASVHPGSGKHAPLRLEQAFGSLWCFRIIIVTYIRLYLLLFFVLFTISSPLGFRKPTLFTPVKIINSSVIPRLNLNSAFGAACVVAGYACSQHPSLSRLSEITQETIKHANAARSTFDALIPITLQDQTVTKLHQAALWDLAVAARESSEWANKKYIGNEIEKMSNITRDLRIAIIRLETQGNYSFSSIMYQFSRIESTLIQLERDPRTIHSEYLQPLFDKVFPVLEKGSTQLSVVMGLLTQKIKLMQRLNAKKTIVDRMGRKSWKAHQLENDIRLAKSGLACVSNAHTLMSGSKFLIMSYKRHISAFQTGLTGYGRPTHSQNPEDNIKSLLQTMDKLRTYNLPINSKSKPATK